MRLKIKNSGRTSLNDTSPLDLTGNSVRLLPLRSDENIGLQWATLLPNYTIDGLLNAAQTENSFIPCCLDPIM